MWETVKKAIEGLKNFISGLKGHGQEDGAQVERSGTSTGMEVESPKKMFDSLTQWAPGLKNFGQEVSAEVSRLRTQGAMELASALFNGDAFVPYGPGQYTPSSPEHSQNSHAMEQNVLHAEGHGLDHAAEQQHEMARER